MKTRAFKFWPVLLLAAGAVWGQPPEGCSKDDSVADCLEALVAAAEAADAPTDSDKIAVAGPVVKAAVAEVEDNQTTPSITGTDGVLRNFLPQILGGLGFQGIKQTETQLAFEKPIHWMENMAVEISLSGTIAVPEVFEDLLEKIPESVRKDRKATLEDRLGDFDQTDLKIAFDYQKQSDQRGLRWGRNPDDYSDVMDHYSVGLIDRVGLNQDPVTEIILSQVEPRRRERGLAPNPRLGDLYSDSELAEKIATWQAAARGLSEDLALLGVEQSKVDEYLGLMISGQPQLFAEHERFLRGELTGPDKSSARLTFEFGGRNNLNDFFRWSKAHAGAGCDNSDTTLPSLACLEAYIAEKKESYERGWRFSLTAQYDDYDDYRFSLPADMVDLSLAARNTWKAKAGIGRTFQSSPLMHFFGNEEAADGPGEGRPGRVDLTAEYEFDSIDDKKKRLVATLTFSQPMLDNMVTSFSVIYANRPEFLGEVDQEFGAHFGITVKRDKPKG